MHLLTYDFLQRARVSFWSKSKKNNMRIRYVWVIRGIIMSASIFFYESEFDCPWKEWFTWSNFANFAYFR